MLRIDSNNNIEITRGNILPLRISAINKDETDYIFQEGDIVRFSIYKNKDCSSVELRKDFIPKVGNTYIDIDITAEETKIGDLISKPVKYCYEVEINPNTDHTQTIIGYDNNGAKYLTLFPESSDEQ